MSRFQSRSHPQTYAVEDTHVAPVFMLRPIDMILTNTGFMKFTLSASSINPRTFTVASFSVATKGVTHSSNIRDTYFSDCISLYSLSKGFIGTVCWSLDREMSFLSRNLIRMHGSRRRRDGAFTAQYDPNPQKKKSFTIF